HHADDAATGGATDIPNHTANSEAACRGASPPCSAPEHTERAQYLTTKAAPHNPRNRIAKGAKALLLEHAAGDVATNCPTDQADDQTDDSAHCPSFQYGWKQLPSP